MSHSFMISSSITALADRCTESPFRMHIRAHEIIPKIMELLADSPDDDVRY